MPPEWDEISQVSRGDLIVATVVGGLVGLAVLYVGAHLLVWWIR